jgi:hypothetical protein
MSTWLSGFAATPPSFPALFLQQIYWLTLVGMTVSGKIALENQFISE